MLSIGLFIVAVVAAASGSDVLEFHDSDFKEEVAKHDIILVEFFAPWCGHCKKLAPEYEKAATKLKDADPPVALAKVDCTVDKSTCDSNGVSGFPTLKIFRNGELSADYDGPRQADGIVRYMQSQSGPSSKELKSLEEFEAFTKKDDPCIIGFFEKDSKLKDSYLKVADTERDRFRFAHTSEKAIIEKYTYTDDIVVFQPKYLNSKFEDAQIKYDGNYDTDKIKKFIASAPKGLCGIRNSDSAWQFSDKPLVVAYFNVDYVKDPKGTNYWRNRILKVGQDYKRKLNFAMSNKDDYGQEIDEYGLGDKKDDKSPLIAVQGADGMKYSMKDTFSMETFKKFLDEYLAGNVEAYMKSEEVPDNTNNFVKVVVAKNFNEIVNQDKDVLVEFYAPWCGHCKKLAPVFDELGEKFKNEDVVIAKMDATANDVPGTFSVSGFPTLYWVPKGKKTAPVPYRGGRELDDFVKYIAKEATNELNGWDRKGKKKKAKKADKEL